VGFILKNGFPLLLLRYFDDLLFLSKGRVYHNKNIYTVQGFLDKGIRVANIFFSLT